MESTVNESKRIEVLKRYDILDTPPDGTFDRITKLASTIFKVPISIISLVDTDRIWFKSHFGLNIRQISREPGLCASAILSDEAYVIENAKEDPRSLANPLVAGEFGLKFYAAVPLRTNDSYNLGTLCIIDRSPRSFTEEEKTILEQLAGLVMSEMEMRLTLRNTISSIKNLTGDISSQIEDTISSIENLSTLSGEQAEKVLGYLDSSKMFFANIESQLNHL